MRMKVAAIQLYLPTKSFDPERAAALIDAAAAAGAKLVVLPELWPTGYCAIADVIKAAEDMQGPTVSLLRQKAEQYGIVIAGGTFAEARGGRVYNTQPLIGADGALLAKYRKAHLFSLDREGDYFTAGDEWGNAECLIDGRRLNIGMAICYDLRFPEFFRNMALRGAALFTVPAAWPPARQEEFRLFCRARAAENRCYVVGANQAGITSGPYDSAGGSLIVAPDGTVLAEAGPEEGYVIAEVDFSAAAIPFRSINDRLRVLDEIDDSLL